MFEIFLGIIILILIIIVVFLILHIFYLKDEIASLAFLKRSQSVKYGQLTEQWIPFSKKFPFDPQNFRFIGKPIDGVLFDEERIVFVEFKSNTSTLNKSQKKVKELVEKKKIEWFELRVE